MDGHIAIFFFVEVLLAACLEAISVYRVAVIIYIPIKSSPLYALFLSFSKTGCVFDDPTYSYSILSSKLVA